MFHELLIGKKPYRASSPQALLYQHVNAPLPELADEFKHYETLIHRMMAKEPSERYSSADEIVSAVLMVSPPNL